jgi:hypothetical protein
MTTLENDEVTRKLLNLIMNKITLSEVVLADFKTQHYSVLKRLQKLYNEG